MSETLQASQLKQGPSIQALIVSGSMDQEAQLLEKYGGIKPKARLIMKVSNSGTFTVRPVVLTD